MSKSKSKTKIEINQTWCKSCGICVDFCPTDVLELDI
ncbi:MAG: 4Fe-4S dicluster domain-containing protein, partial [Bacillota bacterium]